MQINRSTFSILFYLNTSKKKKSGKCPLVGRITVDGKSTAFSTGLELLPEQWDSKQGLATGKSKEETDINKQIKLTSGNRLSDATFVLFSAYCGRVMVCSCYSPWLNRR